MQVLLIERRIRLDRQAVEAEVLGQEFEGSVEVTPPPGHALVRKGEHEIEVQIVETGFTGEADGSPNLASLVHALQSNEIFVPEALGAERDAVESGSAHGFVFGGVGGAGIRFARDLTVFQRRMGTDGRIKDSKELVFGEECWSTASEEDRLG